MVLRRDMARYIFHPFLFGVNLFVCRRLDTFSETFRQHWLGCDFVHPFDPFSEDLGIDRVFEIPSVDSRFVKRIVTSDVYTTTAQRVLQAYKETDTILALWWRGKERDLRLSGTDV